MQPLPDSPSESGVASEHPGRCFPIMPLLLVPLAHIQLSLAWFTPPLKEKPFWCLRSRSRGPCGNNPFHTPHLAIILLNKISPYWVQICVFFFSGLGRNKLETTWDHCNSPDQGWGIWTGTLKWYRAARNLYEVNLVETGGAPDKLNPRCF